METIKSKLKLIRCVKCNGTGLITRKKPFKCLICKGDFYNRKKCFNCENIRKWGNTEECNICWGSGEVQQKLILK